MFRCGVQLSVMLTVIPSGWERGIGSLVIRCVFKEWCQNVVNIVWIYCLIKQMVPVIPVTVITHRAPSITSCNDTSWINVENQLYWEFMYPLIWNHFSLLNRESVGCIFPSCGQWKYQYAQFSFSVL